MPARSRRIDRDDLAWMLFVTTRLAERRTRLKVAAVAGDRSARVTLRDLDVALRPHVTRGVKDLRKLASLVVPTSDDDEDLNATVARETPLAGTSWYRLSRRDEEVIEAFFAGWCAARALHADLAHRAAARVRGASTRLADVERRLRALVSQVRALRPLKAAFFKFDGSHALDGYATAVEHLLRDLRDSARAAETFAGSTNVKGHRIPKAVSHRFHEAHRLSTRRHVAGSPGRDRASVLSFLRTHDDDVKGTAQLLGVHPQQLRRAVADADVQSALVSSPVEASFVALEHLGFGAASTTRKRVARSGARKTSK